ncbi:hypothetical protein E2542_SST22349 [Spatholobus suberectus]|nr:hypothetical protein E2542_SST22349 [Spatholobus suberectus]
MLTLSVVQKQNPIFLSQLQPPSLAYTLCKWGALILPLLATVLIVRFRHNTPSIPLLVADYDYSDTDDDDGMSSSPSTSEFEEDDEEDPTDIANSKSVVKLWDTIGFAFDHSCSSSDGSVVSVYGDNDEHRLCPTPAVVVSAGENASGNLAMRVWDTRLRRRIPAVTAEWGPSLGKTVGVESGGVHKVYVKDDGRYGLTVGDMRNARSPLENVTESHLDLRWPNSFIVKI